jgi:dTDP-glucose 4,6-dehydratase
MQILITGGLGFIGSNFILQLLKQSPKYKIINLDAMIWGSNKINLKQISKQENYQFVKGNITNKKTVEKLISKSDIIINFAAESHVDRSIISPESFVKSNIFGVYTILESIRKHKKKLIQISTDEVYGSLINDSAKERYPFDPSSPYSASKASAEMLVNSYVKTYGIDAIVTRCTNNYGPRQDPEKLIPKTILLALNNKKIPIYGNGKNIRDWIFVEDHCNAILKILKNGKWNESYNISAQNEIDNNKIVETILEILGKSKSLIKYVKDRPGHDFRYSLDSSKIRRKLAWKPSRKFDEGLEITIKWYQENLEEWGKHLKH